MHKLLFFSRSFSSWDTNFSFQQTYLVMRLHKPSFSADLSLHGTTTYLFCRSFTSQDTNLSFQQTCLVTEHKPFFSADLALHGTYKPFFSADLSRHGTQTSFLADLSRHWTQTCLFFICFIKTTGFPNNIENRIYIRGEFRESLGLNFA